MKQSSLWVNWITFSRSNWSSAVYFYEANIVHCLPFFLWSLHLCGRWEQKQKHRVFIYLFYFCRIFWKRCLNKRRWSVQRFWRFSLFFSLFPLADISTTEPCWPHPAHLNTVNSGGAALLFRRCSNRKKAFVVKTDVPLLLPADRRWDNTPPCLELHFHPRWGLTQTHTHCQPNSQTGHCLEQLWHKQLICCFNNLRPIWSGVPLFHCSFAGRGLQGLGGHGALLPVFLLDHHENKPENQGQGQFQVHRHPWHFWLWELWGEAPWRFLRGFISDSTENSSIKLRKLTPFPHFVKDSVAVASITPIPLSGQPLWAVQHQLRQREAPRVFQQAHLLSGAAWVQQVRVSKVSSTGLFWAFSGR